MTDCAGVRIEWAKALARKTRWCEEVEKLKEEMRCVLRSLRWEEREWERRRDLGGIGLGVEELCGRRAYAAKQAADRRRVRESFEELWKRSTPPRGRRSGAMDGAALTALVSIIAEESMMDAGRQDHAEDA